MRKSLILASILLASIFLTLDLFPKVGAQGTSPDVDNPIANVTVEEHTLYPDSLEDHGTKESGGMNWSVYLVKLSSVGDVKVKFNACGSYDPSPSSGIKNYTWTVFQDYPWNNPSNDYDGHTFVRTESMGCDWTYTFLNQTVDPSGFAENPIRIDLEVFDNAGHDSDKFKLYIVVVPEDFGDDQPVWEINTPLDGSIQNGDYVWVNGTVISGSENGDVAIEAALEYSILHETIDEKVKQLRDGKFADVRNLGDGYEFNLKLKIEDIYTENGPNPQIIYLKVVEGDGATWTLYQQITIYLVPRGEVLAPNLVGDIHLPGSPWEEFELYDEFDHNWTSNYDSNAKWFLIQFTDTDCGYCWEEAGSMSLLEDDFGDRVTFISVALSLDIPSHDSSREEVVAFQEKTSLIACKGGDTDCASRPGDVHNWAYFDDLSLSTLNTWNVQGVPFVVILKPNGIVAWNQVWYQGSEVGLALTGLLTVHEVVNDSDGDGVPDSEDPFPYDANETHDDDNDGVGNNSDAFPQDANETHDDDGDGVGNNSDDFPQDPEETTDTDGDGVGDNSDADPDDPTVRIPADLEINVTDTALYVLAAAFLLMAVALVVNRRKKPPQVVGASEVYDSDSIWNES